jgi:choline kinase
MKAILLAAGRGSRMKHLTDEKPKCLLEVRGRPLLEWQLEALRAAHVSDIGIVTGYKRERLADRGLFEFHNPNWDRTNMVSSLECAESWLQNGPCIVAYTDILYQPEAITALVECPAPIAITYDPGWRQLWELRFDDPLSDAETFRLDDSGRLVEIGRRAVDIDAIQGQYMGLLRIAPDGWSEIRRIRRALSDVQRDRMHMTDTLQRIIEAGRIAITALPYQGAWSEFDSRDDLEKCASLISTAPTTR